MSSDSEELILVDRHDTETGHLPKGACHDGDGILHRAFSVFLFNPAGELLLQQRAASKRLWPGFWSNSCCSHPRRGETMAVATRRRLRDELNIDASLEFVYKFQYQAAYRDLGAEHELCHVFLGNVSGEPRPNAQEIEAIRFAGVAQLDALLDDAAERFTPWFRMEWQALRRDYSAALARCGVRPAG